MKKSIHIVFQVLIIAAAVTGTVIEVVFQKGPASGVNVLSYFTIQSNLIVAAVLALNIRYRPEIPDWLIRLKSGALIWILVTGLVFHFLLSQVYHPEGILTFSNVLLHYIVPAGVQLNWLIFEKKGTFRHSFTLIWIIYPSLFAMFSLIRGSFDGFYPYWFVNPVKQYPDGAGSLLNVLLITVILAGVFSVIGNLIVYADRLLAERNL